MYVFLPLSHHSHKILSIHQLFCVSALRFIHQTSTGYKIIDIGGGNLKEYFLRVLQEGFLECDTGTTPFVQGTFASSDEGMKIWSQIISRPSWYQTREEIDLLKKWGVDIAEYIQPGTLIFDLGSG